MKDTLTKSISALLQPNHRDLQTVLSKVKAIQTLNQIVIPLLDPSLQKYCQVANLANGVLVLLTANGSVATQMRYIIPDLQKSLRSNPALRHIREIQCKVRPPMTVGVERGAIQKKPAKTALLSHETAETLLDMAATIEDPELRAIMERIAGHTVTKLPPK
jgi:hypothetical protein